MTGIYVFIGLIVVFVVTMIMMKRKWSRADRKETDERAGRIESDRIAIADRKETREKAEREKEPKV
ncbi:hypothetical protein ACFLW5_01635 [Chloroflexota bacterium]